MSYVLFPPPSNEMVKYWHVYCRLLSDKSSVVISSFWSLPAPSGLLFSYTLLSFSSAVHMSLQSWEKRGSKAPQNWSRKKLCVKFSIWLLKDFDMHDTALLCLKIYFSHICVILSATVRLLHPYVGPVYPQTALDFFNTQSNHTY